MLSQFDEADNFGSLIRPVQLDFAELCRVISEKGIGSDVLLEHVHHDVLRVLGQAEFLSQRYQVVVANPPYMGGKGMNGRLGAWAKDKYPDSKSDLFAMFIERNLDLVVKQGSVGMITMQSWMFLSSYEKLRANLLNYKTLTSMAHLGARAFDSIGGEVVSTTAFVLENAHHADLKGNFLRLVDGNSESEKDRMIREAICNHECSWFHLAASTDFQKIPGSPIAYWVSEKVMDLFNASSPLCEYADIGKGLDTGDNNRFLRLWFETQSNTKGWVHCQKGGPFRKWYGNNDFVINWKNEGKELKNFSGSNLRNSHNYFHSGLSWTRISSSNTAFRYFPEGSIFESTGPCIFTKKISLYGLAGFLNSKLTMTFLKFIAPTLDFQSGHISVLPVLPIDWSNVTVEDAAKKCIQISKADWDTYETSWDFTKLPLFNFPPVVLPIEKGYVQLRGRWRDMTLEIQRLEEENNRIFIDAYGLQDELIPEVPLKEITLTCNPHYRYGCNKTEAELEDLLRADTMREFISYAVGCMFGRYSLDKPGLILANQGETLNDYLSQIPEPTFMPDADNVIPILDGDWFTDDIAERFRALLRVTFGDENYEENLRFIEDALGKKGKPLLIRDYFLKEFYTDHVKRYKKRPIYWLFSSPKGSFNALIYLHRYRPDTVSVVLNDYLRDFNSKLTARKSHLEHVSVSGNASAGEKTKALKDIENLKKVLVELADYERDVLYPLATRQLDIDLDDGVKHNYGLFGSALKKIVGLDAADE